LPNSSPDEVPPSPATEHTHPWRGYFLVAAATLCWGGAAAAGKAVFSGKLSAGTATISPLALTQARATFTVLLLGAFLLLRYGKSFFRISRHDLLWCALAGTLGTASSNYFYYLAVKESTVAIAITLQYTAPVWVLLTMVLSGREEPSLRRAGAVTLAILGIAVSIGLFQHREGLNVVGAGAAMLASFAFAFYNIVAPGLVRRNHPLKVMFYTLLSAAILWIVVNPPWRLLAQHYNASQWRFLFLFACLSMLVPYMFFFTGLKYLDPTRAVIASCLEPVFAILLAAAFLHEGVSTLQTVGILAVLAATVMAQARPA
jgi:drug/metabolite transporter (DMT)-like permease